MTRADLIYVAWSFTAHRTGVVVFHFRRPDGTVESDRLGVSTRCDWALLPAPVANILREHESRQGQWTC